MNAKNKPQTTRLVFSLRTVLLPPFGWAVGFPYWPRPAAKTNCATLGILKFFATHECNDYCKTLKLTNPKPVGSLVNPLRAIVAERIGEASLKHLYSDLEKYFDAWLASLRQFDGTTPAEVAPAKPTDQTIVLESSRDSISSATPPATPSAASPASAPSGSK